MLERWRVICRSGFLVDAGVIHPGEPRRRVLSACARRLDRGAPSRKEARR